MGDEGQGRTCWKELGLFCVASKGAWASRAREISLELRPSALLPLTPCPRFLLYPPNRNWCLPEQWAAGRNP